MKITSSYRNWYKLSQIGEYWIIDGRAIGADGDIGDYNHEKVVREHILAIHDFEDKWEDNELSYQELLDIGFTEEELQVLYNRKDAREYGLKNLGWIRVKENVFEVYKLDKRTLSNIANGIYDILDQEAEIHKYSIEDLFSHKVFYDIPWEVITNEDIGALKDYQYKGLTGIQ